ALAAGDGFAVAVDDGGEGVFVFVGAGVGFDAHPVEVLTIGRKGADGNGLEVGRHKFTVNEDAAFSVLGAVADNNELLEIGAVGEQAADAGLFAVDYDLAGVAAVGVAVGVVGKIGCRDKSVHLEAFDDALGLVVDGDDGATIAVTLTDEVLAVRGPLKGGVALVGIRLILIDHDEFFLTH